MGFTPIEFRPCRQQTKCNTYHELLNGGEQKLLVIKLHFYFGIF